MEGVVKREYLVLSFTQLVFVGIAAREFEGGFHCFRAAIAEERLLKPGNLHEFLSQ